MKLPTYLAWTILFALCIKLTQSKAQQIEFDYVKPNVPYSKVADLPSLPAEESFMYGDSPEQKVFFWSGQNQQQAANKPTIIFIHGGCWLAQFDIAHSLPLTTAFSQNNYNVYSIEYRRTGNGGEWPNAYYDILSALELIAQQLTSNASSLNEVILIGHSAGGHLASLVADRITIVLVNQENLYPLFERTYLVGLAPIIDMPNYAFGDNSCQKAGPMFMKNTPHEIFFDANPLQVKLTNVAQAIMFAGEKDSIVPPTMASHPNATNIVLNSVGHFDWIHPGSDAFKSLIQQLEKMQ